MVDISGCTDEGHHDPAFRHIFFQRTVCESDPVCGNFRAADGIGMVHDICQQESDLSGFIFQSKERNFGVDLAFGTINFRVQFSGIGHDFSIFHPVTAVEQETVIGSHAVPCGSGAVICHSHTDGFFGICHDFFDTFRIVRRRRGAVIRCGVCVNCSEQHIFRRELFEIGNGIHHGGIKQLGNGNEIELHQQEFRSILAQHHGTTFQIVKDFRHDTGVEISGERNFHCGRDDTSAQTEGDFVHIFYPFI